MLSNRLQQYAIKHRNPLKVNFRCPICGDSKKNKLKTRGWINENPKTGRLFFKCFNCGAGDSFNGFLKSQDPILYNEYLAEKYLEKARKPATSSTLEELVKNVAPPVFATEKNVLSGLKKLSLMKSDHPVKKYILDRQIPAEQHHRLYYTPKFMTWVNTIIPDKFPNIRKDEPRLIIPFIDKDGSVFGVSARGFSPTGPRYINLVFDTSKQKVFGLDKVDFGKPYYIVEGALDSLFLENAIAIAGADVNTSMLEQTENATYVFDAEPRNKEIIKFMGKVLVSGMKLCIWPHSVPGKDINDMILAGLTSPDIQEIIDKNTFSGLDGQLKLNYWKKGG